MNPWTWLINQDIHLPLSGSVAQKIEPRIDWFRQMIPDQAGRADQEAWITQHVSYGRQIGWLIEAVVELSKQGATTEVNAQLAPSTGVHPLERLAELSKLLADMKTVSADTRPADDYTELLLAVRVAKLNGGKAYDELAQQLRSVLA